MFRPYISKSVLLNRLKYPPPPIHRKSYFGEFKDKKHLVEDRRWHSTEHVLCKHEHTRGIDTYILKIVNVFWMCELFHSDIGSRQKHFTPKACHRKLHDFFFKESVRFIAHLLEQCCLVRHAKTINTYTLQRRHCHPNNNDDDARGWITFFPLCRAKNRIDSKIMRRIDFSCH